MDLPVVFEDDSVLVVDKPAGVVVNRSETTKGERTVEDWAKERSELKGAPRLFRAGIVHRLDKETSGCLLIAKTNSAFHDLQRQFRVRTVEKTYVAVVYGHVEPSEGAIRVPLARARFDRERFAVRASGKIAETTYRVIKVFESHNEKFTFLELSPKTGRTHQIRVHLLYFRHPVVGDIKYSGRNRLKRKPAWASGMFLHAKRLVFTHPVSNRRVDVSSPLPKIFQLLPL